MATISRKSQAGLVGRNVVDLSEYNDAIHTYLLNRGAEEVEDLWVSHFYLTHTSRFTPTAFAGCKPTHFGQTIRLFFPTEDDALLFSLAFGHFISGSYVKPIQQLINDSRK